MMNYKAIKWVIEIVAVVSLLWFVYHKGELGERLKWEASTKERALQVQKTLQDATIKTMQETEKSNAYAMFIEEEYNAKVNELHAAGVKLDGLRSGKICRGRGTNTLSKSNDSSVHDEAASTDESWFSDEFKQFLESEIRRDQLNEIWINSAVKAANKLCQQPNVICVEVQNGTTN